MIIVLLTLLAIALTLVVAGLFLSPRPQSSNRREISYASRNEARQRLYGRASGQGYRDDKSIKLPQNARVQRTARLQQPQIRYNYGAYDLSEPAAPAAGGWSHFFSLLDVRQLIQPRQGEPTPWLGMCLILVALFGVGMISLQPLLFARSSSVQSFWNAMPDTSTSDSTTKPAPKPVTKPSQPLYAGVSGASQALLRVNQMSLDQYSSQSEFDQWAASACSAAAMTEVINSYNNSHKFRVTDILKVEANLHQITPESGLLQPSGIDITVDKFGFDATHLNNPPLDDIVKIANQGHPVIVSFPPDRVPGGHILVLRGGQGDNVYLADSSLLNRTVMTKQKFLALWGGFSVVVTPKK
ncbi:hypothetical protein KDA_08250 [Dictyobacter alpinus]|uniref:Peptidase C39-like domain-containing protein n=1 Tax=Dictyobacter alpinus TaxID=2014873 RepID=A0A402B1W7_9CHLR|nr:papain-like cysteine protease family protein [Dictyobacter alpinus]GCE25341.1 hypothetical protein KDA_08250 [Dictyobacter alpinus]